MLEVIEKGGTPMAIGFIFNNPGQTQELYDATVEQSNLAESLPEGWIFHAAGPTKDGWRVVEVWESQEAADSYFQGRLGQVLQNVGVSPGQPETFTVYNVIAR
jgi:quinol monooxygenase YgiN